MEKSVFKRIRRPKSAKNIIAYLVFGLICIIFVFLGVTPPGQLGGTGQVASIGKEVISVADYREQISRVEAQYSNMFGKASEGLGEQFRKTIRDQALQRLISQKLGSLVAKEQGIYVPQDQLRDEIVNVESFQRDGRFQRDLYENYLDYRKLSAAKFEEKLSEGFSYQYLAQLFQDVVKPQSIENKWSQKVNGYKMNLKYWKVSKDVLGQKVSVTPEKVQELLGDATKKDVLLGYFEQNKDKYRSEEQVKARHILFKFDQGITTEQKAEVKAKALTVLAEAKSKPETFDALAKEHSQDPGSKVKGGDLGYFGKGRMVPAFEKSAFSMKKFEISNLVESNFGYHIIQVLDKKPEVVPDYETAKNRVGKDYLKKQLADEEFQKVRAWMTEGKTNELVQYVSAKGISSAETGDFGLKESYVKGLGQVGSWVDDVAPLADGEFSKKLANIDSNWYVIQKLSATSVDLEQQVSSMPPAGRGRSFELLSSWLDSYKEKMKVRVNTQITQQGS